MATFLEICQDVARESGTVSTDPSPLTTVGQTGRLKRIVDWTRTAYNQIQRRGEWRWLQRDFESVTIINTREYPAATLGITSRFSRWVHRDDRGASLFSLYDAAKGRTDEGLLIYMDWDDFRRTILIGGQAEATGKPTTIAIDPLNQLQIASLPDAEYVFRGAYRLSPQTLTNDTDVPEMPAEFHEAIMWRALILMGLYDEAMEQSPMWNAMYEEVMMRLQVQQMPEIQVGGPLA